METLTASGCRARRQRLIEAVGAVDQIVISSPQHIQYLSGLFISPLLLNHRTSTNYLLIDPRTGHTTLVVHNLLESAARAANYADEVVVWGFYDLAHTPQTEIYAAVMPQVAPLLRSGTLAVEFGSFPYGLATDQTIQDVTPHLLRLRRQKDQDELALIREAVRGIEAGHRAARQMIRPGVTELDLYNAFFEAVVNEVGSPVLTLGDFVSGERIVYTSGPATPRVLQSGDLFIVDVFPMVNGYRADFTATLSVDGKLSEEQRRLEGAVHAAIAAGEACLKPGTPTREVYAAVTASLIRDGFGGANFPHHAGHGLGMGHPEAPYFLPSSDEALMVGDVVTLEPGSYYPTFGARIERNYLLTENGCELLTHHDIRF